MVVSEIGEAHLFQAGGGARPASRWDLGARTPGPASWRTLWNVLRTCGRVNTRLEIGRERTGNSHRSAIRDIPAAEVRVGVPKRRDPAGRCLLHGAWERRMPHGQARTGSFDRKRERSNGCPQRWSNSRLGGHGSPSCYSGPEDEGRPVMRRCPGFLSQDPGTDSQGISSSRPRSAGAGDGGKLSLAGPRALARSCIFGGVHPFCE